MKGSLFAAAAIVGSALADGNMHRRHDALHNRRAVAGEAGPSAAVPALAEESCGCSTKVITYYGSPTLVPIQPAPETPVESTTTLTSTVHSTSTATSTVTVTPSVSVTPSAPAVESTPAVETPSVPAVESPSVPAAVSSPPAPTVDLPTPGVTSFSETGTYTLSATTLTVTDTTTVCGAATTDLPSGSHTIGEVTTVVSTATTVTCPYATVKTSGTVTTSTIEQTTYVCPSAGTYTVVPGTTTSVPTSTMIVYPTPHTITPGTYTQPETTITATRTDYTYVCPYNGGEASTSVPAAPTSVPVVPTSAPVVPATTAEAPASTSSEPSKPASSGSFTGDGQYGMTFSPYTTDGNCMSKDEVAKNLKIVKDKGFNLVRVYSTDCSSLEFIGDACKELGLSMIIGVFIDGPDTSDAKEQVKDICKWSQWDMVKLIVVGNEAISSHGMNAGALVDFIKEAKGDFQSAGYKGHVTTTETTDVWKKNHGQLCGAVDIVGANIHPFFNKETTAEKAGEFALAEWKLLKGFCPGDKDVVNLETGWPSAGNANGLAKPGKEEQKTAVRGIAKAIGNKSIFFSYADDSWKPEGEFNVERYWGCSSVF